MAGMAVPDDPPANRRDELERLLRVLDLERIEENMFRGSSYDAGVVRVFGGQVAAQALVAAIRTVEGHRVHSLHAYFLRAGDPSRPIVYEVDRIRDGRSYVTRRVVGIQGGRAIFNLQASFGIDEEGYDHQVPPPRGVPPPTSLPSYREWLEASGSVVGDVSVTNPLDLRVAPATTEFSRQLWFRFDGPLDDDPSLHVCLAAYASDLTLLSVGLQPHGFPREQPGFMASLDHAMWFLRPFRVDRWLLYEQESASAGAGRALTRGRLWTENGELAVAVVQEGAVRPRRS
jgi:acyl-CoA thioesterase-2